MADEHDQEPEDPTKQVRQGLGLLWKAARGVASDMKRELDRSEMGKSLDDAGRELGRAASNVLERLASEISKKTGRPAEPTPPQAPPPEDDDFDGVKVPPKKKATGPTPEDPGFRIADDDDKPQ